MRVMDLLQGSGDESSQGPRTPMQLARDPGLLAVGALLLMGAAVLPGLSRVIVLPALLLAPGYAFLRLLGQPANWQAISVAIPVSIVLIVCAALLLDVSSIRLGPGSLGLLLGALTAIFLVGSYARQLFAGQAGGLHRRPPSAGPDEFRHDAAFGERR